MIKANVLRNTALASTSGYFSRELKRNISVIDPMPDDVKRPDAQNGFGLSSQRSIQLKMAESFLPKREFLRYCHNVARNSNLATGLFTNEDVQTL